jgi:hypothetical protein
MHVGNAWGWKARFDVDMGNYVTAGALVTHDRIFKTRVQGYLALNIPLGPWKSMKDGSCNYEKRRIIRNEIIPIQSKKKSRSPLTDSGEDPTRFVFVNNQAALLGDGTFERPFSSLKEAEVNSKPGDVIYVYPGDGTPRRMDEGIILKNNQVLVSSGSLLEINNVEIPAQTPGQNPTITNIHPNEPVVTNPGKTEISNFYYMNPWEYFRLYDAPPYSFDAPSASAGAASDYDTPVVNGNAPALNDVVVENNKNSAETSTDYHSPVLNRWVHLNNNNNIVNPPPAISSSTLGSSVGDFYIIPGSVGTEKP